MITIAANKQNNKNKNNKNGKKNDALVNSQIRAPRVIVIDEDGTNLGEMSTSQAQALARESDLDLVAISTQNNLPVCRILNYSKYLYQQNKKEREQRKNQRSHQLKEIKFRCGIGDGDYQTKKKHIIRFIEAGNTVRITIMFRGREMTHPEMGMKILDKLIEDLADIANVQAAPKMEGRNMVMTIVPSKSKK